MSEKRRGLGRGLGALIPTSLDGARSTRERPVDVFFPELKPDSSLPGASTPEGLASGAAAVAVATEERPAGADPATTSRPVGDETDTSATETEAPSSRSEAGRDGAVTDMDDISRDERHGTAAQEEASPSSTTHSSNGGTPDDVASAVSSGLRQDQDDAAVRESEASTTGGRPFEGLHGELTEVPDPRTSGDLVGDSQLVPVPGAVFAELSLDEIRPNPRQPRTVFDEEALDELVGSIREIGVLQPVVVRRSGDGYELIMGERRWRAAGAAGLESIPAIIRETGDEDLLRDALLENLHRSQLNPLEEAAAYQQLLDDFGCTHDELATRLHRSRPQISNTLRLLKLPPLVQRRVAAGVLSAGHARALLGLADGGAIERLAQRIVAEGLSVRAVEEIVALGGDGLVTKRRTAPRAGVRNEALDALAGRLSDRFETRVKVALGKSRGRLTVEFASVQDLNRILSTLAPEDPGLFHS